MSHDSAELKRNNWKTPVAKTPMEETKKCQV